MKELSKITHDMSEHERAKQLRKTKITIIQNRLKINFYTQISSKVKLNKNETKRQFKNIGKELNIFKEYQIGKSKLIAHFSIKNLYESIEKSDEYLKMIFVIYNLDSITKGLVKIEEHLDNKNDENVRYVHEYISLLQLNEKSFLLIKNNNKRN